MKVIKSISAPNLRKALKSYGINVKRCRQNKLGVLISVAKSDEQKAIRFFNEFELGSKTGGNIKFPVNCYAGVSDFGTIFGYE